MWIELLAAIFGNEMIRLIKLIFILFLSLTVLFGYGQERIEQVKITFNQTSENNGLDLIPLPKKGFYCGYLDT